MNEENDTIMVEEEVVEEEEYKGQPVYHFELYNWVIPLWIVVGLVTIFFGFRVASINRDLNEEIDRVTNRLNNQAELVKIESLSEVDWFDNCYRWNEEDGMSFACYDEDVWEAPCVMSFRVIEKAEDKYGDQTNFILEVKEVCP